MMQMCFQIDFMMKGYLRVNNMFERLKEALSADKEKEVVESSISIVRAEPWVAGGEKYWRVNYQTANGTYTTLLEAEAEGLLFGTDGEFNTNEISSSEFDKFRVSDTKFAQLQRTQNRQSSCSTIDAFK